MAARRSVSPIIKTQTSSPKNNFRAQTARSSTITLDTRKWRPAGIYRPPALHLYLSREVRPQPPEPKVKTWCPPGRYIDPRPLSPLISPEIRHEKPPPEPSWRPAGRPKYERYSYYDIPSLQRSLNRLLKSMPDFKLKPIQTESPWVAINQARDD